ncbi:efflux RND transporter permease subunit, partial [bacterium]
MNQYQLLVLFTFGAIVAVFGKQILKIAVFKKVTFTMILVSIVLISILSLGSLPVELMPNISYGSITIFVDVRGGMPSADVERLVIKPIEESMSTLNSLKNIISSAKQSRAVITLEFEAGMNMNIASLDVRERFMQVKEKLPKEIEKPIIARYDESDAPVFIAALTSEYKTPEDLRRLVEEKLKDKLLRVNGVANVEIGGGRERKIIVNVDERRLASYKLSMNEIVYAIEQNNINMLVGEMQGQFVSFGLRTTGAFTNVDEIANVGVHLDDNRAIIKLSDVADVSESFMEAETYSRLNSKEAVTVYIQKETNANTIAAAKGIKKILNTFKKEIDTDIETVTISDHANEILGSINSIKMTMIFGMMLVILVLGSVLAESRFTKFLAVSILILYFILLFVIRFGNFPIEYMKWFIGCGILFFAVFAVKYKDYRPALLIAVTMPVSLLITISLMYIGGISINVMSLSGLVLGIGLLVDNSIVVVENYLQLKKENPLKKYHELIQEATHDMIEPIIGSTLTTVVVFLSFSFLEKRMQLLYADIAFSVTASLFSSLFCALGVIPMYMAVYDKVIVSPFSVFLGNVDKKVTGFLNFITQKIIIIFKKGIKKWTSLILKYSSIILSFALAGG